jgi:hypothetical protein
MQWQSYASLQRLHAEHRTLQQPAPGGHTLSTPHLALAPAVSQCAELVIGMAPMVIDWIRSSASPEVMCRDAGVCAANMLELPAAKPAQVRVINVWHRDDRQAMTECLQQPTAVARAWNPPRPPPPAAALPCAAALLYYSRP